MARGYRAADAVHTAAEAPGYTADPFGNRIELVAASDRGFSTGRDWA